MGVECRGGEREGRMGAGSGRGDDGFGKTRRGEARMRLGGRVVVDDGLKVGGERGVGGGLEMGGSSERSDGGLRKV